MISKELIQQLRELEKTATPGEWNVIGISIRTKNGMELKSSWPMDDTVLVESFRNNAKALLDELERLQAENEELVDALKDAAQTISIASRSMQDMSAAEYQNSVLNGITALTDAIK